MKKRELTEEEFKKLDNSSYDLEGEKEKLKDMLLGTHTNIIQILKEYVDLKEEYYNIVALWIIGTYFHKEFPTFPFLFFNAIKGSGKTRTMNLVTYLSKDGEMMNSLTEAVLFRTKGTLGIDEYEGITRKGSENLRELLNSCYKKGIVVKRMKQQKTLTGTEQVVEKFEVYRPVVMANIWGMEEVLGDRCITLILDKSNRKEVTNLVEIWHDEILVKKTKELLNQCSLCRCSFWGGVYRDWNTFIKNNYTNYINNTNNTNYINYIQAFKTINLMELSGREVELSLPLCILANEISEDLLKETTLTLKRVFDEKKEEELAENQDINLLDFTSQKLQDENYISLKRILNEFKESFNITEDWVNSKWIGRALKRLNLIKQKRRTHRGVEVILDIEKAQSKIKMFK